MKRGAALAGARSGRGRWAASSDQRLFDTLARNGHNFVAMTKQRKRSAVGAAEFKARCLELVDHVRETAAEYTVTRHGVPVATLGPVTRASSSAFVGSMAGSVLAFDQPFEPAPGAWMTPADE